MSGAILLDVRPLTDEEKRASFAFLATAGAPSDCWHGILESEFDQIELADKQVNGPNRIVIANMATQYVRHQRHLLPVGPFNESPHPSPRRMPYA